jgi:hypothetical protein
MENFDIESMQSLKASAVEALNKELIAAAKAGNIAAAKKALLAGADLNGMDKWGTPLHWAVYNNRTEMVLYLLHLNADYSIRTKPGKIFNSLHDNIDAVALAEKKNVIILRLLNRKMAYDESQKKPYLDRIEILERLIEEGGLSCPTVSELIFEKMEILVKLKKTDSMLTMADEFSRQVVKEAKLLPEPSDQLGKISELHRKCAIMIVEIPVLNSEQKYRVLKVLQSFTNTIKDEISYDASQPHKRKKHSIYLEGKSHWVVADIMSRMVKFDEKNKATLRRSALEQYQSAIKILKKSSEPNQELLGHCLYGEGLIYFQMLKEYFQKNQQFSLHDAMLLGENAKICFEESKDSVTGSYHMLEELTLLMDIIIAKEHQEDKIKLKKQDQEKKKEKRIHSLCAILSNHVYPEFISKSIEKEYEPIFTKEKINIQRLDCYEGKVAAYGAEAYQISIKNNKEEYIIIAHKGTTPGENSDIAADTLFVFGLQHAQFAIASAFVNQILKDRVLSDHPITVYQTGHSLGGLLAEAMAYQFNHHAVTFESPGSLNLIRKMKGLKLDSKDNQERISKIVNYLSEPNILNTFYHHVGTMYHIKLPEYQDIKDKIHAPIEPEPAPSIENRNFFQRFKQNIVSEIIPPSMQSAYSRVKRLVEPILKILDKDMQLHSMETIEKYFVELLKTDGPWIRWKIVEWPCGPIQYFSLAALSSELGQHEFDKLKETEEWGYLAKHKSIRYRVEPEGKVEDRCTTCLRPKL